MTIKSFEQAKSREDLRALMELKQREAELNSAKIAAGLQRLYRDRATRRSDQSNKDSA